MRVRQSGEPKRAGGQQLVVGDDEGCREDSARRRRRPRAARARRCRARCRRARRARRAWRARRLPARETSAPRAARAAPSRDPRRAPRRRAPRSSRCAGGRRRRTSCRNRADETGRRWGDDPVTRWCRTRYGSAGSQRRRAAILRNRLEPVPDAVARLDERVRGRAPVDLLAQAADEDVDRPVAVRLATAPQLLQQLVAGDDAAAVERELVQEPELGRRQLGALRRRRRPGPRAGRSAAPRSRSARRAVSPRGGSPAGTPRARAPRAPSSRTA